MIASGSSDVHCDNDSTQLGLRSVHRYHKRISGEFGDLKMMTGSTSAGSAESTLPEAKLVPKHCAGTSLT